LKFYDNSFYTKCPGLKKKKKKEKQRKTKKKKTNKNNNNKITKKWEHLVI